MVSTQPICAVGLLPKRRDTESALNELINSGFSLENIGVLAKDLSREAQRGNTERERMAQVVEQPQQGAVTGVVHGTDRGGIGGLLIGLGTLAIAGVGTVVEAGLGGTTLANIPPGKGIGAFAETWSGALTGKGIPEAQASIYGDRVSHGDYLVMLEGTDQDIANAEQILSKSGIQEWAVYNVSQTEVVHTS